MDYKEYDENVTIYYLERLKRISLMNDIEREDFLNNLLVYTKQNYITIESDIIYSYIQGCLLPVYLGVSYKIQSCLVDLIICSMDNKIKQMPQLVEYSGVIFKQLDKRLRLPLYNCIWENRYLLEKTARGIIAFTTFVKYVYKTLDSKIKDEVMHYLYKIKKNSSTKLIDSINYLINICKTEYESYSKDVLILIPELLSGSSFLQPPIGCIRVIQQLEESGISCDIFDNRVFNYSVKDVVNKIKGKYKIIIIISTTLDQSQNYFTDHRYIIFTKTCKCVRINCEQSTIIVCGSHGIVDSNMLLKDIDVDYVVRTEFDLCVPQVVKAILFKNEIKDVPNIVYKKGEKYRENRFEKVNRKDWMERAIDYSIIDIKNYFGNGNYGNTYIKIKNWAIMQSVRGCPYNCSFCYNMYGKELSFKKIDVLIQEMKQLQKLKCDGVFFIDQTFTVSKRYTKNLLTKMIKENIHLPWQCETRVDLLDEELLNLMEKAGCQVIWLGIENTNEKVLETINKGYSRTQLLALLKLLKDKKIKIELKAFIILGLPGETNETLMASVQEIIDNKIKITKSILQCTPKVGTLLYRELPLEEKKYIDHFWKLEGLKGHINNSVDEYYIMKKMNELFELASRE